MTQTQLSPEQVEALKGLYNALEKLRMITAPPFLSFGGYSQEIRVRYATARVLGNVENVCRQFNVKDL